MDELLSQALAPVLRDLASVGISAPRVEDRDWTGRPESASAMLWSPDGSGVGVYVRRDSAESERIAMVAAQVQEWAIEELWAAGATNWPPCPRHPNTHPMAASTRDAAAVWMCPADAVVIVPVGEL
ncbi:MAG TPA: hypothetical protein VN088_20700 [Nocardioides sp.]|nr:hypothetical protein [Nocardioides sp.]